MQVRVRVMVWSWAIQGVYHSPHKDRNVKVCPVTKDTDKERESEEVKPHDKSIQATPGLGGFPRIRGRNTWMSRYIGTRINNIYNPAAPANTGRHVQMHP